MPSIEWYAQRLRAMSISEIGFRLQRTAATHLGKLASSDRVPDTSFAALVKATLLAPSVDPEPYLRKADRVLQGRIDVFACRDYFLGDPPAWCKDPSSGRVAPQSYGKSIDYRDPEKVGNIKYLWEPSRHLMLPGLAQAHRLSGERKYIEHLVQMLESWMEQCPYPKGIHWCSSLEVAIRLINWSFTWRIIGSLEQWRAAGVSDAFLRRWLSCIYQHMKFIDGYYSAYSSANNHLIGEAAGVYVGTHTWPAWPQVNRWRARAKRILVTESDAQTHPDGVNAEQAISYQQFVLDFFLVSGLVGKAANDPFPDSWWANMERMLEFIASVMDVGGNVPMIGDADDGFVLDLAPDPDFDNFRSLLATGAILFNRGDFAGKARELDAKTRWLIDIADDRFPDVFRKQSAIPRRSFESGGYYVLGNNFETPEEIRLVFDSGPLGMGSLAAHGHADALSFTLSVSGTPLLIDPGTYAYHTDELWRNYFRGTSAHNTIRVDKTNQSEIGGNFLWSKHAHATVEDIHLEGDTQTIRASHDGYMRLPDPVKHSRNLTYDAVGRRIRVEDVLQCEQSHNIEIFFHFPEYAGCEKRPDGFTIRARESSLRIRAEHDLRGEVFRGDDQLPLGWISYRFDIKEPSCTLRFAGTISGTTTLVTHIDLPAPIQGSAR